MSSSFADLGLPAEVASALEARGITHPFPIQALAVPPALEGRDVCGKAPTGSGKTLAFGLPLAERVSRAEPRRPRGLVLSPTRELASQIETELRPLLAHRNLEVAAIYGGVGFEPQLRALRRGVDVVVACPGRLADLVQRGDIHLSDVEIAVVDEADRMADMGFLPEVRRLLDQVRADRQTLLFSATLDGEVDVLVKRYQRDPFRCEVVDEFDGERTTHHFLDTPRTDRVGRTADLVSSHGPTMVFVRTKHGADRVARQLQKAGVSAGSIHGGRSQSQRRRALQLFTDGKVEALVATDVAARGIHVDDVACVVHFDVAGDDKDYTHRSGRTGRAGADGVVYTLVTEQDASKARKLRRDLGLTGDQPSPELTPRAPRPPVEDADGRRRGRGNAPANGGQGRAGGRGRSGGRGRGGGRGQGQGGGGRNDSGGRRRGAKPGGGNQAGGNQGGGGRRSGTNGRTRSRSSANR